MTEGVRGLAVGVSTKETLLERTYSAAFKRKRATGRRARCSGKMELMTTSKRDWVVGRVGSHAELDAVDQAFWDRAGRAARFEASIDAFADRVELATSR